MDYRHEWKHQINQSDFLIIRRRMQAIAQRDVHGIDGQYLIRSLYFDTPGDRALREKIDGVNRREKFRIRYYNGDTSFIRLEKKSKLNGLGAKENAMLSAAQAQAIADGDIAWMADADSPLLRELYCKMTNEGLRARTIVDYTREAFFYAPGNTRVTLDYDIRTGLACTDFLNPQCITIPVPGSPIILEVKWDEFLPDIVRDAVNLPGRRTAAFSKYAACRIYG